jgi:signal transduction histidine kinase
VTKRSSSRSLRARVSTTVASLAVLLALVVAGAAGLASWQRERSNAPGRAESLAFDVADFGDTILDDVAKMNLVDGLLAYVLNPEGMSINADGAATIREMNRALSSSVIEAARSEFVSFSTEKIEGIEWSFASLQCPDETICQTIVTGASTPPLHTYLLARWPLGLLVVVVGGLLSFLAAFWLVGRSLRPIELMRKELASITASNLDRRVTLTSSGDEVERVGITLNETLDQLDQAVKANERFVADAAHELRSPLTGIRLALEIESANKPVSLLNDALAEVDRASHLVDDLLLLADRAALQKKQQQVDLDDLVREEVARFRVRHPKVNIDHDLQAAQLVVNRESIRRVVANLLDNAAFYGKGQVRVVLEVSGGSTQIHVDDDGPGITPVDRQRVFERFTRLDTSRARSTGGSGLGLAIVKEIADDHKANISISDAVLGGARFTVAFPR